MAAKGQQSGASAIGQETKVADADEAFGQHVQEETAQELIQFEGHQFLLVVVSRVPPTEGDFLIDEGNKAMVGDGDAVGIASEILQHMLGTSEGWFAIDHPVFAKQGSQPGSEDLGLGEQSEVLGEAELAVLKSGLETGPELAAKYPAQHREGEKEARAGWDPVGVIERQSTGGDDAVDMGMKLQLLIPGMEHAEEADLGSEMAGCAGDLEEGFGTGLEQ